ncbi:MAG: glycosyltransferase [Cyanobacteria bacterium]|nr:glycosyltransferase [Cyanobacteriota bacterium]MDW8201455.1 glycosyltransferase family 2 protein [Cyanobacteriota bacterium SKYGB_h_bin112]
MPIVSQALTPADLPPPPPQQLGWCWTEGTAIPYEPTAPLPRISIIIPSYNQGRFIEETIRSVLLQAYPNLELIVMDGGSTDTTMEIIQRYDSFIHKWVSEPDRGQSHAVNKGIQQATGDLIGWQNSDDIYQPGTFWRMAAAAVASPDADVFFGEVRAINEQGQVLLTYPVGEFDPHDLLPWPTNLFNQGMFIRKLVFDRIGLIDETYHHCMDYDLFWRMVIAGCRFQFVPGIAAHFRHHYQSKGATQHDVADREFWQLYKRVYTCQTLPTSLRVKALTCLQSACLRDYACQRRSLFRQHVAELFSLAGIRGLTPMIVAKLLIDRLRPISLNSD